VLGKLTALINPPRKERIEGNSRNGGVKEGNPTFLAGFFLPDGEKFNPTGRR